MKKFYIIMLPVFLVLWGCSGSDSGQKIDRKALVERNSPTVTEFEELSSLSVGNGNFAFTVDATGLQSYPELYSAGVPLGTQTQWGWHSFDNPHNYRFEETLKDYDFRGWDEPYAVQFNEAGRPKEAADWYRVNPHRLHLGNIGLELTGEDGTKVKASQLETPELHLDMWTGVITSNFGLNGERVAVSTASDPEQDKIGVNVSSPLISKGNVKINFRFPYPTGGHADDASDFNALGKHKTEVINKTDNSFVFKRTLGQTVYYATVAWTGGNADIEEKQPHYFVLTPASDDFSFTCEFTSEEPANVIADASVVRERSADYWKKFWTEGAAVDFSDCKDARAAELERRVVLSQYLMAIQSAGMYPPQETGLTYNSWFGKFHLEMHWWHAAHFPLWDRAELLERSMWWYESVEPVARYIAERQNFKGIRWMKMTDPSGTEAPSKVGSFLIWQQPHFIYLAELIYRNNPSPEILEKYAHLVDQSAEFMASFVTYDMLEGRYIIQGCIAAQETLRASEVINPPFEMSYWHFGLSIAQKWRERSGLQRKPQWDEVIDKLSPLASLDGLYLASEDAVDTYKDIRFTSDHMAVLGAYGILPKNQLFREDYMTNTLEWIWENWNWGKTWGWDYPMTAMNAARLGHPEKAVGALMMDKRTNTYLVNGHNYQDARLRVYLPGNGGLLTAVAMMCAGWDGSQGDNPGFPKDGNWNVKWEGLKPMP